MVDEGEDVVERGLSANAYEEGRNVGMYSVVLSEPSGPKKQIMGMGLLTHLYTSLAACVVWGFRLLMCEEKSGGADLASLEKGFNDLSFLVCKVRKGFE